MSDEQSENARIILPAGTGWEVRAQLVALDDRFQLRTREEAIAIHNEIGGCSVDEYEDRFRELVDAAYANDNEGVTPWLKQNRYRRIGVLVRNAAQNIIQNKIDDARGTDSGIHTPTLNEVAVCTPSPTYRLTVFPIISKFGHTIGEIRFDSTDVADWTVFDQNRSVEQAHDSPIAEVFFGELDKIQWTDGTGGRGEATEPWHRSAKKLDNGLWTSFSYGPLGAID